MKLTVAICTWNRCALLAPTLERLRQVRIPAGVEWECVIVNNNCTDQTDAVIARFAEQLPIHRVFQPVQGLSNARNAAIDAASGDYIIWTDDDVLVDAGWLEAYVDGFRRWPEASVFGGPVKPWFEGSPPQWLVARWRELAGAYAVRDLGNAFIAFDYKTGRVPYGANFAIRSREQRAHRYDPRLGLNGGQVVLGEETAVVRAILDGGGSGWWLPGAEVEHWLPQTRQTVTYLRDHYRGVGRMRNRLSDDPAAALYAKPRWLWRLWLQHRLRYSLKRATGRHIDAWLMDLLESEAAWAHLTDRGAQ
jgi:glycosyltransferase involved in cell wall biosynthesis